MKKLNDFIKNAHRIAKKHNEEIFIIIESNELHLANDVDLKTFFAGNNNIIYSTVDGHLQ